MSSPRQSNGAWFAVDLDAAIDRLAERVVARLRGELVSETGPIRPRLLTVKQAAVYLGRSKHAVQHMVAQGRIPVVRDGRRVLLDVRELDRWIEANTERD